MSQPSDSDDSGFLEQEIPGVSTGKGRKKKREDKQYYEHCPSGLPRHLAILSKRDKLSVLNKRALPPATLPDNDELEFMMPDYQYGVGEADELTELEIDSEEYSYLNFREQRAQWMRRSSPVPELDWEYDVDFDSGPPQTQKEDSLDLDLTQPPDTQSPPPEFTGFTREQRLSFQRFADASPILKRDDGQFRSPYVSDEEEAGDMDVDKGPPETQRPRPRRRFAIPAGQLRGEEREDREKWPQQLNRTESVTEQASAASESPKPLNFTDFVRWRSMEKRRQQQIEELERMEMREMPSKLLLDISRDDDVPSPAAPRGKKLRPSMYKEPDSSSSPEDGNDEGYHSDEEPLPDDYESMQLGEIRQGLVPAGDLKVYTRDLHFAESTPTEGNNFKSSGNIQPDDVEGDLTVGDLYMLTQSIKYRMHMRLVTKCRLEHTVVPIELTRTHLLVLRQSGPYHYQWWSLPLTDIHTVMGNTNYMYALTSSTKPFFFEPLLASIWRSYADSRPPPMDMEVFASNFPPTRRNKIRF